MNKLKVKKVIINGRSLAGKDTIADYLVKNYGFTKITFATPIYEIAEKYFGMRNKDRELLQKIGQSFRNIDSDIWVKYAFKEAKKYTKCVVSDLRQLNEYKLFTNQGFLPIRVNADFDIRIERAIQRDGKYPDISLWENSSETGADNCWYIEIDNNGSFEDLYRQIDNIIKQK